MRPNIWIDAPPALEFNEFIQQVAQPPEGLSVRLAASGKAGKRRELAVIANSSPDQRCTQERVGRLA